MPNIANEVLRWLSDFGLLAIMAGAAFPLLYKITARFAEYSDNDRRNGAWARVQRQFVFAGIAALEAGVREGISRLEDDGTWSRVDRDAILEIAYSKFTRLVQNADVALLYGGDTEAYKDIIKQGVEGSLSLEGLISRQRHGE